jgi:predicted RNase H-like HicB family nuclease
MHLTLELEREEDGRWVGVVLELPGVMAYGGTEQEALMNAQALALRVVADRIEHGETPAGELIISFALA